MTDHATATDAAGAFRQFVAAINEHDVDALSALVPADHVFVDSLGNLLHGGASMEAGWRAYFEMCPDYWIRVSNVLAVPGLALGVGEAGGTIDGVEWRTPAAWRAVIHDGKIAQWQVFADNKPVYEILAKRGQ